MITGDESNTDGRNYVHGKDPSVQQNICNLVGYCPQSDAFFDELSCGETLEVYATLRGVPYADRRDYVLNMGRCFDLLPHMGKKATELSGGNKRKLSTALAVIGSPEVIVLDEPTIG